mmetsp:Transcript_44975/g.137367  ORF Transcript_44975/g.137367 Transcript_44975/m.137367 type:complete len:555 (+) Transcript_44975:482-2146(+)
MRKVAVSIMDGKSMNALFGDPCPGTTKCLRISYLFYDDDTMNGSSSNKKSGVKICRSSFQEHERVILKKEVTFYQKDDRISCTCEGKTNNKTVSSLADKSEPKTWSLEPATSETILPVVLPFLDVRQRALCQLVCKCWRFVVRKHGVAQTVDFNDGNVTRCYLRGILAHSYSSLQSLFLNDFNGLSPDDLHPAIPHMQKLRALDISRCHQLDDTTLLLLSKHVAGTLEVLYMKGVCRATDEGLTALCKTCLELRVLELSNIPITDQSGVAIGENLSKLRALYMRDNFQLTNKSIDVITERCTKLSQLTLWGCTRMKHIKIGVSADVLGSARSKQGGCKNLVLLNLWGCHSLADDVAASMTTLKTMRTLVVSECHRLTDSFVVNLSQAVPQLQHLHLRYVRRITDVSLNAIADHMQSLSCLDVSFCTKLTAPSLGTLLQRHKVLSELRLYSCYQLDVTIPRGHGERDQVDGGAGRALFEAVMANDESCLNVLDLRGCTGRYRTGQERDDDETFRRGMASLGFEQKIAFFFVRRARWNAQVRKRLVQELYAESIGN